MKNLREQGPMTRTRHKPHKMAAYATYDDYIAQVTGPVISIVTCDGTIRAEKQQLATCSSVYANIVDLPDADQWDVTGLGINVSAIKGFLVMMYPEWLIAFPRVDRIQDVARACSGLGAPEALGRALAIRFLENKGHLRLAVPGLLNPVGQTSGFMLDLTKAVSCYDDGREMKVSCNGSSNFVSDFFPRDEPLHKRRRVTSKPERVQQLRDWVRPVAEALKDYVMSIARAGMTPLLEQFVKFMNDSIPGYGDRALINMLTELLMTREVVDILNHMRNPVRSAFGIGQLVISLYPTFKGSPAAKPRSLQDLV